MSPNPLFSRRALGTALRACARSRAVGFQAPPSSSWEGMGSRRVGAGKGSLAPPAPALRPPALSASCLQGRVCGLCGNFDDNAINDFTTRSQSVVGDALEFGNSWKFSPTCPDALAPRDPCTANPYRKSWAQKQCSLINSPTFEACHAHVRGTSPRAPGEEGVEVGGRRPLDGVGLPLDPAIGLVRPAMWEKVYAVPEPHRAGLIPELRVGP